jgi:hypothetical protein
LVEIYDAGTERPIDLLDQVVSIIRREKRPDERMRDIAILMRDWQQVRRADAAESSHNATQPQARGTPPDKVRRPSDRRLG